MDIEKNTMRKVFWRVMPLLMAGLFMSNLDRLNISFAAVRMNVELGMTAAQFGLAVSAFFVGYVATGVPSNMMVERIGARRWFALLLITWGLLSCATGFVGGLNELVVVRFLLGLAEGGYPPGVLIFLTFWVPQSHRGRFVGWTMIAQSTGTIAAPLLSGFIVGSDGVAGLSGWRLMFILQGLPASLIGLLVWKFLADGPRDAKWLVESERSWLTANLDARRDGEPKAGFFKQLVNILDQRFVLMTMIYLFIAMCGYGGVTFLPLILENLGYRIEVLGVIIAVPSLIAVLLAPYWGRWSDKARRKEIPCMTGCLLAATGFVGMAAFNGSPLAIVASSIALVGVGGAYVTYWPLPLGYLKGRAAGFAVALLYAAGSIGGIISPYTFGLLKDMTSDFVVSLFALAGLASLAAACAIGSRFARSGATL